jgi:hypothetical protein
MDRKLRKDSTFVTVHAAAPPVGLVEVTTLSRVSTATQRLALAHETLVRFGEEASTDVTVHADVPPVGLVAVTTLPA